MLLQTCLSLVKCSPFREAKQPIQWPSIWPGGTCKGALFECPISRSRCADSPAGKPKYCIIIHTMFVQEKTKKRIVVSVFCISMQPTELKECGNDLFKTSIFNLTGFFWLLQPFLICLKFLELYCFLVSSLFLTPSISYVALGIGVASGH